MKNKILKHIVAIAVFGTLLLFISCNSENANNCFQTTGDIIRVTMPVSEFSKIQIEGETSLFIKQGDVQEVIIETGENLVSDVEVAVTQDGVLRINDANKCNLFRAYEITKAYVTTPNIKSIRNASSFDVRSEGVLQMDSISLISDTRGGVENPRKGGDFYLAIECQNLSVSANGQSVFYLTGTSQTARVSFADENPRFEGRNLEIGKLSIFTRSANKIITRPINEITGTISGTGDVLCVNRPPIVDVEVLFTGQLLFE